MPKFDIRVLISQEFYILKVLTLRKVSCPLQFQRTQKCSRYIFILLNTRDYVTKTVLTLTRLHSNNQPKRVVYVVLAVHRSLPPVLSTYSAVLSKELGKSGLVD